jgi:hypothetical protein
MNKYLTIKEAVAYTGKSESTVKRVMREFKQGVHSQFAPPNNIEVIYQEQISAKQFRNLILTDFLDFVFGPADSAEETTLDPIENKLNLILEQTAEIGELKNSINEFLRLEERYIEEFKKLQAKNQQLEAENQMLKAGRLDSDNMESSMPMLNNHRTNVMNKAKGNSAFSKALDQLKEK